VLCVAAAAASLSAEPCAAGAQTVPAAPSTGAVVLHGTVFDSVARGPLADATVQAVRPDDPGAVRTARTDSAGRYRLEGLSPARYVVGFLHPLLETLGVELKPVLVDLTAGASGSVPLAVPAPASLRAGLCPAAPADDSTGAIAGAVRDADTGAAVADATVVITWSEIAITRGGVRTERRRVPATVRPDGGFLVCGVPTDGPVEASAGAPGRTSGLIEIAAPPRGLAVQEFALGPAAPAAVATAPGARPRRWIRSVQRRPRAARPA
jgi:hypothetical protein